MTPTEAISLSRRGIGALITQAATDEIGHETDDRSRRERGLPPNCQAFLAAGFSVSINHLLKHAIDAIKTAPSGAWVIEAGESVAVVETAEAVLTRQAIIVWGMIKKITYLKQS